jgi:hypothetical protein
VQDPKKFYSILKELLTSCGVALVLLPNLKNCGVNGAVKWLGKDKVVLVYPKSIKSISYSKHIFDFCDSAFQESSSVTVYFPKAISHAS